MLIKHHLYGTVIIAFIVLICCDCVSAAEILKGTLLSPPKSGLIRLRVDKQVYVISPNKTAKILRGQIGKDLRKVAITDLAPGDIVVAIVDSSGQTDSIKAYFGIVKGVYSKTTGAKLTLVDGRQIPLAASPQVALPTGKLGKVTDIPRGAQITCRINPVTSEAWTIIASNSVAPSQQTATPTAKVPSKPSSPKAISPQTSVKIDAITYSAPVNLKLGDPITVDMSGTPNANATFEVKGLISATAMKEISPGSYRATVYVPKGKYVNSAALVGRLSANNVKAKPVQASRLITVADIPTVQRVPATPVIAKQQPTAKPAAIAVKPAESASPVVIPISTTIEQQKPVAKTSDIIITTPPNGATIRRALLVRGNAEPDSKLDVTITFSNGLNGLLELSGQVASQKIAVGNNGEFRMGPVALEGPLATRGLQFTIKAHYCDRTDHCTARVQVIGERD